MEEFRKALKGSDTVKVVLTGVGETVFSSEEVSKYIEELERLARIGRATEIALNQGFFVYDNIYNFEGHITDFSHDDTVEELLQWLDLAESEE